MKKWMDVFQRTALFDQLQPEEIASALDCLQGTVRQFDKKQFIQQGREFASSVGIVLSGLVFLTREDEEGRQSIYSELYSGDIFGETALLQEEGAESYRALAGENSSILFVHTHNIVRPTGSLCPLRSRMIENLLTLTVKNNRLLYRKLDIVSHKSLRDRVMHYLVLQARRNHSLSFRIPFTRADFADFLTVDRSALSRELCRMQEDGLLRFYKNHFELLDPAEQLLETL